jgi:hypothetical protein
MRASAVNSHHIGCLIVVDILTMNWPGWANERTNGELFGTSASREDHVGAAIGWVLLVRSVDEDLVKEKKATSYSRVIGRRGEWMTQAKDEVDLATLNGHIDGHRRSRKAGICREHSIINNPGVWLPSTSITDLKHVSWRYSRYMLNLQSLYWYYPREYWRVWRDDRHR